jgi:hypothetical protein
MSTQTQPPLIVSPEINFARLKRELGQLAWTLQPDTMVAAPLVPGEPEVASWKHRRARGRIVYTFNPVVSLRVLSFYGDAAAELKGEVAARLPVLTLSDLLELLKSDDTEKLLLGIFAVGESEEIEALGAIMRLVAHPEQLIARAAAKTQEKLLHVIAERSFQQLAQEKARRPDRSVLFPLLGDASHRQQVLQWLIHDYREANEHILAVLRSALGDKDWEVRATAMLAAARFKATSLIDLVRKVELPHTSREGLTADDRRLLRALRHAAVLLLEGRTPPEESTAPLDTREAAQAHMLRCVAGLPVHSVDRVFLFVQSLTQPPTTDEDAASPEVNGERVN